VISAESDRPSRAASWRRVVTEYGDKRSFKEGWISGGAGGICNITVLSISKVGIQLRGAG
jgi:hypothetical protein